MTNIESAPIYNDDKDSKSTTEDAKSTLQNIEDRLKALRAKGAMFTVDAAPAPATELVEIKPASSSSAESEAAEIKQLKAPQAGEASTVLDNQRSSEAAKWQEILTPEEVRAEVDEVKEPDQLESTKSELKRISADLRANKAERKEMLGRFGPESQQKMVELRRRALELENKKMRAAERLEKVEMLPQLIKEWERLSNEIDALSDMPRNAIERKKLENSLNKLTEIEDRIENLKQEIENDQKKNSGAKSPDFNSTMENTSEPSIGPAGLPYGRIRTAEAEAYGLTNGPKEQSPTDEQKDENRERPTAAQLRAALAAQNGNLDSRGKNLPGRAWDYVRDMAEAYRKLPLDYKIGVDQGFGALAGAATTVGGPIGATLGYIGLAGQVGQRVLDQV